jgi:hypothetical protein
LLNYTICADVCCESLPAEHSRSWGPLSWLSGRAKKVINNWSAPRFHSRACEHLKAAYSARIAGQEAHLEHIAKTICRHIRSQISIRPLVILTAGPPGVGKSWTTRVTAQALYLPEPVLPRKCEPGKAPCEGFIQISSYSFMEADRGEHLLRLRERFRKHLSRIPQSLIVFEDFDRMDCDVRDFIRDVRHRT